MGHRVRRRPVVTAAAGAHAQGGRRERGDRDPARHPPKVTEALLPPEQVTPLPAGEQFIE